VVAIKDKPFSEDQFLIDRMFTRLNAKGATPAQLEPLVKQARKIREEAERVGRAMKRRDHTQYDRGQRHRDLIAAFLRDGELLLVAVQS
jgi:hypothetical protein